MFLFLLIVQTLVAVALITVILMQRSEGGGLTSGGGNSSLMTARGAADFLTRATTILAAVFIGLSIWLAALAAQTAGPRRIDANSVAPAAPVGGPALPAPTGQPNPTNLPGLGQQPSQAAPGAPAAPAAPAPANQQGVPIAQ